MANEAIGVPWQEPHERVRGWNDAVELLNFTSWMRSMNFRDSYSMLPEDG